jgi:hypothetical protein
LSNREALELYLRHRSPELSHLLLSHLSANNNCPKIVQSLFDQYANGTRVIVASRFEESPLYQITKNEIGVQKLLPPHRQNQLQFSFE